MVGVHCTDTINRWIGARVIRLNGTFFSHNPAVTGPSGVILHVTLCRGADLEQLVHIASIYGCRCEINYSPVGIEKFFFSVNYIEFPAVKCI